ncbi:MAG: tetraacyldisaccharide 4'-kinase, partial [Candidatus Limisoma sp.]
MKEYLRITREAIFTPLSYIYGAITYVRNKLFDLKILKSVEFDIPIISIGNLAV